MNKGITEIAVILLMAAFGVISIPVVKVLGTFDEASPSPTTSPIVISTATPEGTQSPEPHAFSTTIPENGTFEDNNGGSNVKVSNDNGSTKINVSVEGNGSADVNVKSHSTSSSTSSYTSKTEIESSTNSN